MEEIEGYEPQYHVCPTRPTSLSHKTHKMSRGLYMGEGLNQIQHK